MIGYDEWVLVHRNGMGCMEAKHTRLGPVEEGQGGDPWIRESYFRPLYNRMKPNTTASLKAPGFSAVSREAITRGKSSANNIGLFHYLQLYTIHYTHPIYPKSIPQRQNIRKLINPLLNQTPPSPTTLPTSSNPHNLTIPRTGEGFFNPDGPPSSSCGTSPTRIPAARPSIRAPGPPPRC